MQYQYSRKWPKIGQNEMSVTSFVFSFTSKKISLALAKQFIYTEMFKYKLGNPNFYQ